MPKNGLTIIKKIIQEDFSTYDVRYDERELDLTKNGTFSLGSYQIHTDDMYIAFQYCEFLEINIAIVDKDNGKVLFVHKLSKYDYGKTQHIMECVRDIIHAVTYEAMDKKIMVKEFKKYFKNL